MNREEREELYNKYFPDESSKAAAFDRLANLYYFGNFGTESKSEIDLMMFSEYLDRIYQSEGKNLIGYSDRKLSLILGITENRVYSYKIKKELKYPSQYNWKEEFVKNARKAEAVGDRIRLHIDDPRLFTELNARIYELGAYNETSMTKQMLNVSAPVFIALLVEASKEDEETTRKKAPLTIRISMSLSGKLFKIFPYADFPKIK